MREKSIFNHSFFTFFGGPKFTDIAITFLLLHPFTTTETICVFKGIMCCRQRGYCWLSTIFRIRNHPNTISLLWVIAVFKSETGVGEWKSCKISDWKKICFGLFIISTNLFLTYLFATVVCKKKLFVIRSALTELGINSCTVLAAVARLLKNKQIKADTGTVASNPLWAEQADEMFPATQYSLTVHHRATTLPILSVLFISCTLLNTWNSKLKWPWI